MVKWPPTRGWKGYFESRAPNYSSGCLIVVSSMLFQAIGASFRKWQVLSSEALPPLWSDHLRYKPSRTKCHDESKFKWKHNQNEWVFFMAGFYDWLDVYFLEYKELTLVVPSHPQALFFAPMANCYWVWPPLRRASERCGSAMGLM